VPAGKLRSSPVYVEPALLDFVSSELKRRMQGKLCFAFTSIDKTLFRELAGLAKAGYASYREKGYA
jgi:hypothetical protein